MMKMTKFVSISIVAMPFLLACGGGKQSNTGESSGHTILPSSPQLNPPAVAGSVSSIRTSGDSLVITGSCSTDAGSAVTVYLGGDANQTATCTDGTFSFTVDQSNDGTLSFSIRQESLTEHPSDPVTLTWVKDTIPPDPPVLTNPNNPYRSSTNTMTVSGTCESGGTVNITGSSTVSASCTNGSFSSELSQSTDGTYTYLVSQTDSAGNASTSIGVSWLRDTQAPSAPTILVPGANPFVSSDSEIILTGTCESGATVSLSGSATDSIGCVANAYSFEIAKDSDSTFNFSLHQTDSVGNISASVPFQWIRDSGVPSTPLIASPAASPYYSSGSSIAISGTCADGFDVELTGNDTQTTTCVNNSFSFTVNKTTDLSYNFAIRQKSLADIYSGQTTVTWVRDSIAPSTPALTLPSSSSTTNAASSLTFSGTCEAGTTVNLTGSATFDVPCNAGTFSTSVTSSTDGTFNYSVKQTDQAGNASATISRQWNRDTVVPSAPTLSSPISPLYSNASSVLIQGACESGATVQVSGAGAGSATCSSNSYSITLNKSSDGVYVYSISQTDPAGNLSNSIGFTWNRDATVPAAPSISSPASNPYTSSADSVAISGSCEVGATINYTGDSSGSTNCSSGSFSFTVNGSTDGIRNYSMTQTDRAGNTSSSSSQQWIRNSGPPSPPTITSPIANPYYSSGSNLTISGTCTGSLAVELSGTSTSSTTCASGTYSFSVSVSLDGTYNYSVRQKSVLGEYSAAANLTWARDTSAPSTPVLSSPTASPLINNANSITIAGTCESSATVNLNGSSTSSTTCSNNSFNFNVSKSSDGIYNFTLTQTDRAGNISSSTSQQWRRDTLAPATPTLSQPSSNPFTSADSNITIAGGCESGATVALTGASTQNMTCPGTSLYSFNVSKSVDGDYDFAVRQTDAAGNHSANLNFQWTRDATIPFTPAITSPSTNPFRSSGNTVTIYVTCDTTISPVPGVVTLSGAVIEGDVLSPAGSLEQDCTTSPLSFTIQKTTNGAYQFYFSQENPNNSLTSATAGLQWIRDTVAPNAPTISSPTSNPFTAPGNLTIAGSCENNATVNLSGDSTQNTFCSGGVYSFSVVKSEDATYTFTVGQTDLANNSSATSNLQWIRDSNSVPAPTITSPVSSPFADSSTSLTLSGACNSGSVVTLWGEVASGDILSPANSLTQNCPSGVFTFIVSKATDGTFNLFVKQTFNAVDSATSSVVWTLDTTAPTISIGQKPALTNPQTTAVFSFTSDDANASFECQLDGGPYTSCSSPVSYSSLSNASHTFNVRATDLVGNISSVATHTWTQASYSTIALYHLNSGTETTDSGYYTQTAGFANNLSATGSPSNNTTGKYPSGSASSRTFGTGNYYSVADNPSLNVYTRTMTVEGFVRITSGLSTNQYYTLVSKNGTSGSDYGWEVRLVKSSSSRYRLYFVGSLNGTSTTIVSSNSFSVSTSTWYYFAVRWNLGTVNFYFGSSSANSYGSKTIGTPGSAVLATTTAPLRLGAGPDSGSGNAKWLTGALDEVRISQTSRTISFPSSQFNPD